MPNIRSYNLYALITVTTIMQYRYIIIENKLMKAILTNHRRSNNCTKMTKNESLKWPRQSEYTEKLKSIRKMYNRNSKMKRIDFTRVL